MSTEISLHDLWGEYKRILQGGTRIPRALELEKLIHEKQKLVGTPAYDFDKKWDKIKLDGTSTISGPPPPTSKVDTAVTVPQASFTFEQAKEKVGENDFSILEDCNRMIEARMICVENISMRTNPENQKNLARRGQSINQTLNEFNRRKSE